MLLETYCGEGGVGRRNALRGEWVRRRAGKQLASEWWLTPVSDSSDCRRELKSIPPAARGGRAVVSRCWQRATHEEEREPTKKKRRVYVLLTVLFCVIKHLFWLVTPDFLVLPSLIPEPCYTYSWLIHFGLLKGPLTEKSKFPWFFEVIVLLKTSCKFQNSKLSQSKNSLYWSHSAKTTGCGIVRLNMDSAEDQCLFSSAHWFAHIVGKWQKRKTQVYPETTWDNKDNKTLCSAKLRKNNVCIAFLLMPTLEKSGLTFSMKFQTVSVRTWSFVHFIWPKIRLQTERLNLKDDDVPTI